MRLFLLNIFLLVSSCLFAQYHNLDFYLERARTNSPLLKDYQNQMLSNGMDSAILRASYKPQVNAVSADFYAPTINGYGYDNIITNGAQISAIVQANKTIVSKNNLNTQYQSIHLQNETIGNTAVIAQKDLKKTVTSQYISVYGDMTAMNFNKEILALLQKEELILKKLTENNVYKQSDYLTFYVSLQQQQLISLQSEIQFKNDYAMLNYLCGIVDTSAATLIDPDLQMASLPDIYSSVFYHQYTIDSLKFINQKSVIDYSYKPKLNVFADAGYVSSLSYQPYKNFGASLGLALSLPIYDGRQKQLKYNKVNIAENTRTVYRDFFLHQYDQQVAQLIQQFRATESMLSEINDQIKYSNALIEVNGRLLETGNVRITDFILAINTYLNARHLLNQNYISRLQIINQINYWQQAI
ncbi:MAG TPA: TolC family protein [Puia sp.]|nr:TolC family protein [Puia sp.]